MPQPKKKFRPYEQARDYVRTLGLKSVKDYEAWSKSGVRPGDIPGKPSAAYGAQFTWPDFLGIGGGRRRLSKDGQFRPFEEARAFVRTLGLAGQRAYFAWSKGEGRPADVPSNPVNAYGAEWTWWADFLGTDVAYRPFEEARAFARTLGLKTRQEWQDRAAATDFPADVPKYPEYRYDGQGWEGWAGFLGTDGKWTRDRIREFLRAIGPALHLLQPAELYAILARKRLLSANSGPAKRAALQAIESMCAAGGAEVASDTAADVLERLAGTPASAAADGVAAPAVATPDDEPELEAEELARATELPRLRRDALHAIDRVAEHADAEILEFLVQNRVAGLWQAAIDGDPEFALDALAAEVGGKYFTEVRDRFLAQHREVDALPTPPGYAFAVNGTPVPPNLMQRLTAYRLLTDKRLVNASQTGAGKTLSALTAAAAVGARLTVVLAVNATLDGWAASIAAAFPGTAVLTKPRTFEAIDPARPTYLLYNYESFQQPWAADLVRDLTARHLIDVVVLDELQQVRWREGNDESLRRENVRLLLDLAGKQNTDLRVLGMSATPVINDLHEAATLLELVTGEDMTTLPVEPTVVNAVRVYQMLTSHGLRYRVKYQQSLETHYPTVDGASILRRLRRIGRRDTLAMEQLTLEAKLPLIQSLLRPGTVVFTQMVSGIVEPLAAAVRAAGLRPGLFTGVEKSGLPNFLGGRADVLIGSEPVGTGVDGLPRVANRLVFASLPWTSAQYEQVVGRLHRQGQVSNRVEVYVPLVELRGGGRAWSWDRAKLDRIRFKRTLSDAAVDGVIPAGKLPSPAQMQAASLRALDEWIAQVTPGTHGP
ncbi:MAG: hypothetical protein C0501_23755 [Isosphaera sp.]|nr:hypothetical protein [Isosphaera sp.]